MNRDSYIWLTARLVITFSSVVFITFGLLKISEPSPYWLLVSFLVWVFSGVESIRLTFDRPAFLWRLKAELNENRFEDFHLLIAPFVFVASFAIVCRELGAINPEIFVLGTSSVQFSNAEAWISFMLDQVARAILLDVFETFRFHVSRVDYEPNFFLCSFIFFYKSTLTIMFWRFVFLFYEHWQPTLENIKDGT